MKVHPHGSPENMCLGRVEFISPNQRSIAVLFEDNPPFSVIRGGGVLVHPEGIVLLASRLAQADGQPVGPWVELMGGGHYEIEPEEL